MSKLFSKIEPVVFFPVFILLIGVTVGGLVNYNGLLNFLLVAFEWTTDTFGWIYTIIAITMLVLCVVFFIHPLGKTKFGGPDAKPEMSTFAWFSVTLTTSIGVALILWGSIEPVTHFMNPPTWAGVEAGSEAAASFATSQVALHWAFNQYAVYTVAGIVAGLAHFNYGRPMAPSSGLYWAIGDNKLACNIVDALCLITCVGGMATSMGTGIVQIATGAHYALPIIPDNNMTQLIVAVVIVFLYTFACCSGVDKAMSVISNFNVYVYIFLLAFVVVIGPTVFMGQLGMQSLGELFNSGIRRSFMTSPFGDSWVDNWTINFYLSIAVYVPIMGLFFAKIARGRTIRAFIGMDFFICSIFNIIWIDIFGGAAIFEQAKNLVDLNGIMQTEGLQAAAFAFFNVYPLKSILVPLFALAIFLSFVTMGQSLVTTFAAMSMKGGLSANETMPSKPLMILFGVFIGAFAYILLGLMGVDVIKYTYMVVGFPIFIIMLLEIYSLLKWAFFPDFSIKKAMKEGKAAKLESVEP